MEERVGEAFELGEQLTVIGSKLTVGAAAPAFELDWLNPEEGAVRSVRLKDTDGQVRLLNLVNSVDTPVCHVETHRWDTLRSQLPSDVAVYTISMDLPFAQERWAKSEGIAHPLLSSHRSTQFGEDYGALIQEWRLLQRAVFVLDRACAVVHAEYVADQMTEPDYDAAIAAAKAAL
jgi:thiol peroxidase